MVIINGIKATLEDLRRLFEDITKGKTKTTYKRIIKNKLYINTL